jgi:hypothetical protein
MKLGWKPEKQRPPRWDSFPLGYASPRWDAGVRYWPGAVLLVSVMVIFFALTIPLGFTEGPLLTAAVVASYPTVLILAPIRKRLVPREVAVPASAMPMLLWVLGWLLVAAGTALYPLSLKLVFAAGNPLLSLLAYLISYSPFIGAVLCIRRAPAWEQWRSRPPRKGRQSPQNGSGASTGAATVGQPH